MNLLGASHQSEVSSPPHEYTVRELRDMVALVFVKHACQFRLEPDYNFKQPSNKIEVVYNEVQHILNDFLQESPSFSVVELVSMSPETKEQVVRFITLLSQSNKYLLRAKVELFVTQAIVWSKLRTYTRLLLKKEVKGVMDQLVVSELSPLDVPLSMFAYLPPMTVPSKWYYKLLSERKTFDDVKFLGWKSYLSKSTFPYIVESWFRCFRQYMEENNIPLNNTFILTEIAIHRSTSRNSDGLEEVQSMSCHHNERIEIMDDRMQGTNTLKAPIIVEWMSGEGERLNPIYVLSGVFDKAIELTNAMEELRSMEVKFGVLRHEVTILALKYFQKMTCNSHGKRVIVISSYMRNYVYFTALCEKYGIVPFFLPEHSSHFLNPVELKLTKQLRAGMTEHFFKENETNISVVRLLKAYHMQSKILYQRDTIRDALKKLLTCSFSEYGEPAGTVAEMAHTFPQSLLLYHKVGYEEQRHEGLNDIHYLDRADLQERTSSGDPGLLKEE